jgi:hypothetical protein
MLSPAVALSNNFAECEIYTQSCGKEKCKLHRKSRHAGFSVCSKSCKKTRFLAVEKANFHLGPFLMRVGLFSFLSRQRANQEGKIARLAA